MIYINPHKIKFVSISYLFRLTIKMVSNNIIVLLVLCAVSAFLNKIAISFQSNFLLQNTFSEINTRFINTAFSFIYILIYMTLAIICAYVVMCYEENTEFDINYAIEIISKNILGYLILEFIFFILFIVLSFIFVLLFDTVVLMVLAILQIVMIAIPTIYCFIKYKFCLQFTGFYNIGILKALSKSAKLTRNKLLNLIVLYPFIIILLSLVNSIAYSNKDFFSVLSYQILIVFFFVFDAYVAYVLVSSQREVDEFYDEYYRT